MSIHDHFSPDYVTARAKFRAACAEAGLKTERFLNPETGMQGEDLTTDAVWIGPPATASTSASAPSTSATAR